MNKLANSTSPYLLQHANNPVNWYPWGAEALQKAKDENKLILVSIGYSACHWCHVMEHESFEDEAVAGVMNEYFVCIKVDREERPDVDQIYMSAIQLMSGRGGWPLNCICLPDQRPIYGGTYFRKNDWTSLLFNLADFYKTKPEEAEDYAVRLTDGIKQYESVAFVTEHPEYTKADLETILATWRRYIDPVEGGFGGAPKFPMPNNSLFLMRYVHLMKDNELAENVKLTLKKMAFGGIYDHIGGGFARYAVDGVWHVPHFEKMLYDNGQLLSLYAEAYTWQPDPLYKTIADEIITFINRELTSPQNGFYSALDADSEGKEGKFYIFTKTEIEEILGNDADVFNIYYHVTEDGNWEEERSNVFYRREEDAELAKLLGLTVDDLVSRITASRQKVLDARGKRIRPGLDNKILASWNGLMLKGLCEAYRAFHKPQYLELALKNAEFITSNLLNGAKLSRVYKSSPPLTSGEGRGGAGEVATFLDDYANVIDAFIALYEVTFDETWLIQAQKLTDYTLAHYYNQEGGIFFYTADNDEVLIARKSEIMDGVIPASNSVMARNLKKLGLFFDNEGYLEVSAQLLRNIVPHLAKYGTAYSNWQVLLLDEVFGTYEVAITGNNAEAKRIEMEQNYIPNKIILGGKDGSLPLLAEKFNSQTRIFVCRDKTCGLPAYNISDALKQINN
ncbi:MULTISPECIES: thioredoxin domain-containing protein [unclassified Mucilaginibacter]|uniref:thioredoxin domain-containing protein n=1 Tax=unclassified Mucilaginibacter TaxID=2617802 RepID=UPI002AC8EEAB|nr:MULTISPECIES: thioredoxin domain-containing protein [unclassified Mucilaginibacter]MEB0262722.1 thioredoxin domain-containing protein [Mucilaginibacter sp. 10I4]MEB0279493.1 thioredoxin domain-containing protein [Mucilaginibacter sp. 10B2]MEB0302791.1 thioredoxin domain-containing protein [Mucilaginibacter sp. 5C4]WPX22639.1 thioredoxin domain-containing protein [Mucilaginibacter sp. 5C4]